MGLLTTVVNQERNVVVIMCDVSTYAVTVPVPKKTAASVAMAFVEQFILKFGASKTVTTDQGQEFLEQVIKGTIKNRTNAMLTCTRQ